MGRKRGFVDMDNAKAILEGLLFLSGEEGLSIDQMILGLKNLEMDDIRILLDTLKEEYSSNSRGIELVEYANRFKFVTKEFVYPYGKQLFEEYKQPITRVEIEEIRGVNCEMMLKKLVARGLIEAKDRLDAIGKPLLYRVTDEFLDAFQLEDLKELPELPQTKNNNEELFEGE